MKAYAKVNLYLDIKGLLPDGYHNLLTVMQRVSLCDEVTVKKARNITVKTDKPDLPTDERNTAFSAARLFFDKTGIQEGAGIEIKKNIPHGAGLGGGSADAAATLIQLNNIYNGALSDEELLKLALAVGADVPFCLSGKTALCRGKGEIIEPLKPIPKCAFVIVKPPFSVSTPKAYAEYDKEKGECPDSIQILKGIEDGDLNALCKGVGNALLKPVLRIHPQIDGEIKSLLNKGALAAMMTGSGSAVFGIFKTEKEAQKAAASYISAGKQAFFALPL